MSLLWLWWRWGFVALFWLFVAVFLIFALQRGTLQVIAPAIVALLGAGAYVRNTVEWARNRSRGTQFTDRAQLDLAASVLAVLVKTRLDNDPIVQRLKMYEPIDLKWSEVNDGIVVGQAIPPATNNNTHTINSLILNLPGSQDKRLAILGPAGAGKTTLAILLAMTLLGENRGAANAVPIILSLAGWDPSREPCLHWVARRISQIYPALCDTTHYGYDAPRKLLADGKILPILDGLDELPENVRSGALEGLNELMGSTNGLILTARTKEYNDAVDRSGEALDRTFVLELCPVAPDDIISYVKDRTKGSGKLSRWQAVFNKLKDESWPDHVLVDALSTPLAASLARRVCNSDYGNPEDLLNRKRFPTSISIKDYLLATLVGTVFEDERRHHKRGWTGGQAKLWLATIATGLRRSNTYDFRWWHLYRSSPWLTKPLTRATMLGLLVWIAGTVVYGITTGLQHGPVYGVVHGLGHGLAFGLATFVTSLLVPQVLAAKKTADWKKAVVSFLVVFLAAGSAYGIVHGCLTGTTYGLSAGIVIGLGFGLIVGAGFAFGVWFAGLLAPPGEPIRADLRVAGRSRQFINTIKVTVIKSTAVGLLIGIPSELIRDVGTSTGNQPPIGFWICVLFGLCYGIVIGWIKWVSDPRGSDNTSTPRSSLIADRTLTLFRSILLGLAVITVFATIAITQPTPQGILHAFLTQGGIEGGVIGGFIGFLSSPWSFYQFAHIRLAAQGKLPWRLQAFLELSRQLYILRQAGDSYQFRHAVLQDHLAEN